MHLKNFHLSHLIKWMSEIRGCFDTHTCGESDIFPGETFLHVDHPTGPLLESKCPIFDSPSLSNPYSAKKANLQT